MTYEHLWQPQKAVEVYDQIISSQAEMGTNAPPSLASIADMARWRVGFIQWQTNAETVNHRFADTNTIVTAKLTQPDPNHE